METAGSSFAQAPLNGEIWRDSLVHSENCGRCLDLKHREVPADVWEASRRAVLDGRGRMWMVAASSVTVVGALAAVVAHPRTR